jgi:hypothetical protein
MSVNYNFPSVSTIRNPSAIKTGVATISTSGGSSTANFAYDSKNYIANQVFLCSDQDKRYFVIQSTTDPNVDSPANLYVAIELDSAPEAKNPSADIDGLIKASSNKSTTALVNLNTMFTTLLSSNEGSNGKVVKSDNGKCFLAKNTLGVDLSKTGTIQDKRKSPLGGINLSDAGTPSNLVHSYIGWDLSCVLLDDNGEAYPNPTTNTPAIAADSANIIVMLTMVILIIGCAYLFTPIIYPYIYHGSQVISKDITDFSINAYFAIMLVIVSIPTLVKSGTSKQPGYLFFFITFVLSYISGSRSVVGHLKSTLNSDDKKGRIEGESFASDSAWLNHVGAIFKDGLTGDNSTIKMSGWISIVILFVSIILVYVGSGIGEDVGTGLFVSGMILYFFSIAIRFAGGYVANPPKPGGN